MALLSTVLALCSLPAFAQDSLPKCDGDFVVVRLVQVKPGGTMKGLLAAIAAHQAWYRSHGFTQNEIVAARVVVPEPATGKARYSDSELISDHFNPPGMGNPPGRGDAAWNAYVKMYDENSRIVNQYVTCMLKRK